MRTLLATILVIITSALALPALAETPFAAGQIWTLKGNDYPTAQVLIDRLEIFDGKPIAHITIFHVPVTNDAGEVTGETVVGHMPFTEEALRRSVGALVQADSPIFDQFEAGYADWKAANGGVFTITVPEGIAIVLQAMHNPPPAGTRETASSS